MKLQDGLNGGWGRVLDLGRLEGGKTVLYWGRSIMGRQFPGEPGANRWQVTRLTSRHAECIFTLDRVTMPPVISLPLTVLLLLLICSLQLLCLPFSHSFTLFFVSSCGFPFHFFIQLKSKWLWVFYLTLKQASLVIIFPSSTFRVSSVFLSLLLSSSSLDSLLTFPPFKRVV